MGREAAVCLAGNPPGEGRPCGDADCVFAPPPVSPERRMRDALHYTLGVLDGYENRGTSDSDLRDVLARVALRLIGAEVRAALGKDGAA